MTDYSNLMESIKTLLDDQEAFGWDRPSGIYQIDGPIDDPTFHLKAERDEHPVDILVNAYNQGFGIANDAVGIAAVTEGWTAVSFERMCVQKPEFLEQLKEIAAEEPDADEELILFAAKAAWEVFVVSTPPDQLPKELMNDIRNVFIVLRTGQAFLISRERGETEGNYHLYEERPLDGIPLALERFMNDQCPLHGVHDESDAPTPPPFMLIFEVPDNSPFKPGLP